MHSGDLVSDACRETNDLLGGYVRARALRAATRPRSRTTSTTAAGALRSTSSSPRSTPRWPGCSAPVLLGRAAAGYLGSGAGSEPGRAPERIARGRPDPRRGHVQPPGDGSGRRQWWHDRRVGVGGEWQRVASRPPAVPAGARSPPTRRCTATSRGRRPAADARPARQPIGPPGRRLGTAGGEWPHGAPTAPAVGAGATPSGGELPGPARRRVTGGRAAPVPRSRQATRQADTGTGTHGRQRQRSDPKPGPTSPTSPTARAPSPTRSPTPTPTEPTSPADADLRVDRRPPASRATGWSTPR